MWEENQDRSTPSPGSSRDQAGNESARLSKSIKVKGEISGSGDLYIDGEVEGKIDLQGNSVTVGPEGRVQADVSARDLSVQGRVQGNVQVSERALIRATGTVEGELRTARICVEDGAVMHATVDVVKPEPSVKETKPAPAAKQQATKQQPAAASSARTAAGPQAPAEWELTAAN